MTRKQTPNAEQFALRPLHASDFEAVVALDGRLSGTDRRGFFQKRLTAASADPSDYVYVALTADETLAGFAMARLIDGEFGTPGARAQLDAFGVDPGHQHHGAGHLLIDEVRAVLGHKKVSTMESQIAFRDRALLGFFGEVGFRLAPRLILGRSTEKLPLVAPEANDAVSEPDYGEPGESLEFERVPVRSMSKDDLGALARIDAKLIGQMRPDYFARKYRQIVTESGVRVSLIAEQDDAPVGFIMARVDFGSFGRAMPGAVIDTLGVDPGYQGKNIGHALMSRLIDNLSVLRVEAITTEIAWNQTALAAFLSDVGFRPAQRVSLIAEV